ncbi:MFS transporter [Halopseudomonas sp. Lyrl_26]|uniref:MFS transporter n=1 Tax=Halopseudomonas sp. Lyrl_26 TaxID=3110923 RepID=UPI003F803A89
MGALIQHYRFDSQQAGLLVTLFLAGGMLASLAVAPSFHRFTSGRWLALAGFTVAALAFQRMAGAEGFSAMALLHIVGSAATGIALSMTHGTVARSANPHRLFAWCGTAQGVFALIFLSTMPGVMSRLGAPSVFLAFAAVIAFGAFVTLFMFPAPESAVVRTPNPNVSSRIPRMFWAGVLGVCCMSMVQSMAFGFLERAGADRGFGAERITIVLVALGLVNLFPTAIAALLEKRVAARSVLMVGPVAQAMVVIVIFASNNYLPYAMAGSLLVATLLFTHVFAFGLLARLDLSGRALAATPAMMMAGAAIGPVLGGTLIKFFGYPALGAAAAVAALMAVMCFRLLPEEAPARLQVPALE